MKRCTRCSRVVEKVPGFCSACGNYVDKFAPDAEAVQLGERARAAAAGEVATVTEAFTHVPTEHRIRVEDVTPLRTFEEAEIEHLPYRFGKVHGAFIMVIGACGGIFGAIAALSASIGMAFVVLILGSLFFLVGFGVYHKKKAVVIAMLGLSALMNIASIARNPASFVGLLFVIPIYVYYIKRLDEME